jgi:hypothetical protein
MHLLELTLAAAHSCRLRFVLIRDLLGSVVAFDIPELSDSSGCIT